jgi:hypothetical protein
MPRSPRWLSNTLVYNLASLEKGSPPMHRTENRSLAVSITSESEVRSTVTSKRARLMRPPTLDLISQHLCMDGWPPISRMTRRGGASSACRAPITEVEVNCRLCRTRHITPLKNGHLRPPKQNRRQSNSTRPIPTHWHGIASSRLYTMLAVFPSAVFGYQHLTLKLTMPTVSSSSRRRAYA